MNFNQVLTYLTDGPTDTLFLLTLVFIDTVLGTSQAIKNGKNVISRTLITGVLTNVLLTLVPSIIYAIRLYRPSTDPAFVNILSSAYTLILGYAIIQSILANASLVGIKLPDKLLSWLANEIKDKEDKNNKDNTKV